MISGLIYLHEIRYLEEVLEEIKGIKNYEQSGFG